MGEIQLWFRASLQRLASSDGQPIHQLFRGDVTIKHVIESAGVPHTEVEAILVNKTPVGFDYRVRDKDEIVVYPQGELLPAGPAASLREPPPRPFRFLLDVHLGKLARMMRLLGFDTAYQPGADDAWLAQFAQQEARIMVTRDRGLLKRRKIVWGCCLLTRDSQEQLRQVMRRYNLAPEVRPWSRCLRCNGLLDAVDKASVWHLLEPKTRLYYDTFQQCRSCQQVYWKGSHYQDLQRLIQAHNAPAS